MKKGDKHSVPVAADSSLADSVKKPAVYEEEKFEIHDSLLDLTATKRNTEVKNVGEIRLEYNFKARNDTGHFSFPYPQFSDVVFSDNGIAVKKKNNYHLSGYYLFKEDKLLLPLIGMNFLMLYVIDLKSHQVMLERRTHIEFIWVNEETGEFMATDSPQMTGTQTTVFYNAFVYNIKGNEVVLSKKGRLAFSTADVRDSVVEFSNVKRIFDK
ncbi:hypothetical protein [Chitinophaga arvensicola]|uniref:Uncharacterized protein n=1 Tax=Chitinophaga arvensicola TaxID=29529 RepID=A0A1I0SA43_9BACT|nr:hypothetical protein [Chitinophaga arvensicola]SEW52040.1 hypothetical protein SAMN04488122_4658 [Chitinophaga arvensicola]